MKNKLLKHCFLLLLLLVVLPFTSALGITGPVFPTAVRFEPNYARELNYIITEYTGQVEVHAEGDLAQYVTFTEPVESNNRVVTVTAKIKLPERINKPGSNSLFIVFNDNPPGGGTVSASIIIRKAIWFEVLYPYKKVDVSFNTPNVNTNETANMVVGVRSLSELDITQVRAVIDVFDSQKNHLTTLETPTKRLPSGESIYLTQQLSTIGYLPGAYTAQATVFWDDNQTKINSTFKIGTLSVKVNSYTKEFVKGAINKFDVEVESKWNKQIEQLSAELYINDTKVGRTSTETLPAWQKITLQGYFDATGYELGDYPARLITHFDGESAIEEFTASIVEAEAGAGKESPGIMIKLNTTTFLIILVVIIAAGNIIYFYLQKRKAKKQPEQAAQPVKPAAKPKKAEKIAKK